MSRPKLDDDLQQMTEYCTYCPKMCRFSCPTAAAEGRETSTPWGMMRLLEMCQDGSVPVDADVARAFYHCTGCRRCQSFCNHDNDVPRALWEARRQSVQMGFLPKSMLPIHDAFQDHATPHGPLDEPARDHLQRAKDEVFDDQGTVAFWPDCSTVAHHPQLIAPIGRLIARATGEPVRLITDDVVDHPPCCGFPLTAAGIATADDCADDLWPAFDGVERIFSDCAALAAWQRDDASWQVDADDHPPIAHIYDLICDHLSELGNPPNPLDGADALLHHSCLVQRQLKAQDQVQTIVDHIFDTTPSAMAYDGDESQCCGGQIAYRRLEPTASKKAATTVLQSLERNPDQQRLLTTSSGCATALNDASGCHGDAGDSPTATLLSWVCEAYDLLAS